MESAILSSQHLNPLGIRPDQVFSEVSAKIAGSVLNLVPDGVRYDFFEKLQRESGVVFDGKDSSDAYVIRGDFEQILLAKIKLEKYIIDLQMGFLVDQYGPGKLSPNGSACWKSSPPNNNTIKLKKVPSAQALGEEHQSKASYVVLKNGNSEICTEDTLKSRRKVGKPRKLTTSNFNSAANEPLSSTNQIIPPMEEANVLSGVPSTDTYDNNGMVMKSESKEDDSTDEAGVSAMSFSFEEEAERKAAEWLNANLQHQQKQQQNGMDIEDRQSEDDMAFQYSCELCSFKAQREGQFLKHVLIHGKRDTVHMCEKCDFASVSLNHYNRHKLSHSDSIFKCPQCPYQTDEAKQLARHVTVKHTMIDNPPKRASILQCNECQYNTTKIYHFERHLLVHNRDLKGLLQVYHCEQCPYKTHRKEHFLRHRDNVHIRHRPYQCNMCSRSYKREDALQQHQVAAHNAYPQFSQLPESTISHLVDLAVANGATTLPERKIPLMMSGANSTLSTGEPSTLGVHDLSIASSLPEPSFISNCKLIGPPTTKSCKVLLNSALGLSEESSCSSSSLPT